MQIYNIKYIDLKYISEISRSSSGVCRVVEGQQGSVFSDITV